LWGEWQVRAGLGGLWLYRWCWEAGVEGWLVVLDLFRGVKGILTPIALLFSPAPFGSFVEHTLSPLLLSNSTRKSKPEALSISLSSGRTNSGLNAARSQYIRDILLTLPRYLPASIFNATKNANASSSKPRTRRERITRVMRRWL
jgi:hypothetical protein